MTPPKLMVYLFLGISTFLNLSRPSNSDLLQNLSPECDAMVTDLGPCAQFMKDAEDFPSLSCCGGVHSVAKRATGTSFSVKEICECLKKALDGSIYDPARVPDLPKKCGARFELPPVEHYTDCSELH